MIHFLLIISFSQNKTLILRLEQCSERTCMYCNKPSSSSDGATSVAFEVMSVQAFLTLWPVFNLVSINCIIFLMYFCLMARRLWQHQTTHISLSINTFSVINSKFWKSMHRDDLPPLQQLVLNIVICYFEWSVLGVCSSYITSS